MRRLPKLGPLSIFASRFFFENVRHLRTYPGLLVLTASSMEGRSY